MPPADRAALDRSAARVVLRYVPEARVRSWYSSTTTDEEPAHAPPAQRSLEEPTGPPPTPHRGCPRSNQGWPPVDLACFRRAPLAGRTRADAPPIGLAGSRSRAIDFTRADAHLTNAEWLAKRSPSYQAPLAASASTGVTCARHIRGVCARFCPTVARFCPATCTHAVAPVRPPSVGALGWISWRRWLALFEHLLVPMRACLPDGRSTIGS
jgi:hypothetical protein